MSVVESLRKQLIKVKQLHAEQQQEMTMEKSRSGSRGKRLLPTPPKSFKLGYHHPVKLPNLKFGGISDKTKAAKSRTTEPVAAVKQSPIKRNSPPEVPVKTGMLKRDILRRTPSLEGVKFTSSSEQGQVLLNTDKFQNPTDVGCLALRCATHRHLALVDLEKRGLFLPYFSFNAEGQSIDAILEHFAMRVLLNRQKIKLPLAQLVGIDRLQIPKSGLYVSRFTYQMNIEIKSGQCACEMQHPTPLEWCSADVDLGRLRSNEPLYFLQLTDFTKRFPIYLNETSVKDIIERLQQSVHKTIIECAALGCEELLVLYNEFLLQCYPATTLSRANLKLFLDKLLVTRNLDETRADQYFRAFGGEKKHFLNFEDLIVGLAAVATPNSGKQRVCQHHECQKTRREIVENLKSSDTNQPMDLELNLMNLMLPQFKKIKHKSNSLKKTLEPYYDQFNLVCQRCSRCPFYLASHSIVLSDVGEVNEIVSLDDPKKPEMRLMFRNDLDESSIHILANDLINRIKNFGSFALHPNRLAAGSNDLNNVVENWFFESREEMVNYLKMIANKAERIFAGEPRVLNVSTPVFTFGDIHGNLKDLLSYSQLLWKQSPFINQGSYLFLGDYVDRGLYGVECIIYLFCMKILAPKNFFLLRGNHEIREIQDQFTFTYECSSRFSIDLWDAINNAFDNLPIAAVVDGQLFCAHGGIPVSVTTLEQLNVVPIGLESPMITAIEAWEVLWNDPISDEEFQHLTDFERNFTITSRGFARNTKRGTAYMYTEEADENFFAQNHLSGIIRGHEVFEEGFRFHHKGNVMTVFSTSHYADLNNRACVFFLDRGTIRIIQMAPDI